MADSNEVDKAAIAAAIRDLNASRNRITGLVAPGEPGVYGIYLRQTGKQAAFTTGADGIIYVGRSTNLAAREFDMHFSSAQTGFSTLRRSLGALLKSPLALRAWPRSPGPSETNVRNFRFQPDGDERLTAWMQENLEVGVHATRRYEGLETTLVVKLRPLLNLTNWANPEGPEIKRLRKVCADEARASRPGGLL